MKKINVAIVGLGVVGKRRKEIIEKNKNYNLKAISDSRFKRDFKRLWEYYLTYCEEGFKAKTIDVHQFLLKKIK